jgi:MFS family permease
LIYALNPVAVAALCSAFFVASVTLVTLVRPHGQPERREPPTLRSALIGFDFIRHRPRLLGVISLDLFVVLLGGATALLPIYAKDILDSGPIGLGLLRSAPAVGALLTTVLLSRYPVERRIGMAMFTSVAIFGMATIVFGLSTWMPLSLLALAVLGASDSVSVVIRFSLVQIETPEDKRGRVSAANYLFVGSSNTLGDFESGTVAAWFGAVPSVLIGGIGSLLIAGIWMLLFPTLRRIDRYEPANESKRI